MYTGVVIRDVGVDGAGNWATHIGRQPGGRRIEAQQYKVGRPWSGWVGTNVVREVGLILSYTGNRGDMICVYQIGSHQMASWRSHGGYYEVAWPNQGYQGYNELGGPTWVLPENGTYTFKVRGDILIVYVVRNGNFVDTSNLMHKISWYEPGRKIGMLFDFNLRSWRFTPDP